MPRESCLYVGPYARWCFPVEPDPFAEGGPAYFLGENTELWDAPLCWNLRSNFTLKVETDGVRKLHLCCAPRQAPLGRPSQRVFMQWGMNTNSYTPIGTDLDLLAVDRPQEMEWFHQEFRVELDEWVTRFGTSPTFHWGVLVWYEP